VIIPDVNILVYAYNKDAKQHRAAREWWERTLAQPHPVGLPWVTILGFIRISTQRRIIDRPMFPHEATERVRSWLALPNVQLISPGEEHAEIFFRLIDEVGTAGDLTTDAHLAALTIEHQGQLVSTDTDFARFRGLRWFNPTEVK
jgi:toxin-antitoxin system PIN domain toxin